MSLIFVDRPPTDRELERLRLILSTFQDGTGMLAPTQDRPYTLPGWRDFERACALAFNGKAVESKFFVDVIFPLSSNPDTFYGVQCKMRGELRKLDRDSRIYVEVTNAARELWSYLSTKGITERNYRSQPELAGNSLIEAVEAIKRSGSQQYPAGPIDLSRSYYLVLLWSERDELYQLFQLPLRLSKPDDLIWRCHVSTRLGRANPYHARRAALLPLTPGCPDRGSGRPPAQGPGRAAADPGRLPPRPDCRIPGAALTLGPAQQSPAADHALHWQGGRAFRSDPAPR